MEELEITGLMYKLGYRICGGGKYIANCYGKNARLLMFGDDDNLLFAECVFDSVTAEVYELTYLQGKDDKEQNMRYTWRHPDYKAAHRKEAALLRETKGWTELPYKLMGLKSVLDSILAHK